MASSQVQIVSSCVLRDHNRRERYIESNAHVAMQKNLKDLVQSCISAPPRIPNSNLNENSDSLARAQQRNNRNNNHSNPRNNDKWGKAREIVFQTGISPQAQSECCVETRAVSSLVKRWRDFEAESKNLNLNNGNNNNNNNNNDMNSSVCSTRSNSNSTFTENLEVPMRNYESAFDNPSMAEDSFIGWECDASGSRDSNATEKERIRVVDIIRKLTSVNGEEYNERVESSLPKVHDLLLPPPPEMRNASGGVMASPPPRIRGRQAMNDLLMQMERERHKELQGLGERKPVSKFSQRGRIQALLKVRFLRHELEVKNGDQINSAASSSGRTKNSQGSTVMHLRARFNTGVEHSAVDSSPRKEVINNTIQDVLKSSASNQLKELIDHIPIAENPTSKQLEEVIHPREVINVADDTPDVETCSTSNSVKLDISHTTNVEISSISNEPKEEIHPREVTGPVSPFTNIVNDTPDVETCSTSNRVKVDIKHDDVIMTPQPSTSQLKSTENPQKESSPNADVLWQLTSLEVKNLDSQESQNTWKGKNVSKARANKQQSIASLYDWINDISPSHRVWEDQEANNRHLEEPSPDGTTNLPDEAQSEWEEDQSSYQQLEETYYDWVSDIARPRSDWEGLRQERYQEMLDPSTDNRDIKQLLERRSVSSFLSSGLRNRIDQLMISRTQGQQTLIENRVEEHMEGVKVVEENELEEASAEQYEEIEEEDKSPIARQFCEVGEYFDQTPSSSMNSASPSLLRSWSPNRNDYVSDDSVASPSLQKFLSFKSYTQETQQSSSFRNQHPSIEMELIYDLRGHMEQLHQEISDLRKSIKSCMNMQVKVQRRYMKHEAAGSTSHSARRKGESINRIRRKGTCCLY